MQLISKRQDKSTQALLFGSIGEYRFISTFQFLLDSRKLLQQFFMLGILLLNLFEQKLNVTAHFLWAHTNTRISYLYKNHNTPLVT